MNENTQMPKNLSANVMPSDGYVLTVDGKSKIRYETEAHALAAGAELKHRFPVVRVTVFDPIARVSTPVELSATEATE